MVAVLGPELTPDGKYYAQCKSLMREMEVAGKKQAYSKESQTGAAELELVLYAQQLILFAPQAVPAAKHIPVLMVSFVFLIMLVCKCSSLPGKQRPVRIPLLHEDGSRSAVELENVILCCVLAVPCFESVDKYQICTELFGSLHWLPALGPWQQWLLVSPYHCLKSICFV